MAGKIVAYELVLSLPPARVAECFATRLTVTDDPCHTEFEATRTNVIDRDQADPLVWVSFGDLDPGQWLRDRWRDLFGSIHAPHLGRVALAAKFLAIGLEDRWYQPHDRRERERDC